jgi:excisionase family DNA binding protein
VSLVADRAVKVEGVLVGQGEASALLVLLAPGRRQFARDGLRLPPSVLELLRELEATAGPLAPPAQRAVPEVRWIGTAEAAALLGLRERQARSLAESGRLRACRDGRRWLFDHADVLLEADARAAYRQSSAVIGSR